VATVRRAKEREREWEGSGAEMTMRTYPEGGVAASGGGHNQHGLGHEQDVVSLDGRALTHKDIDVAKHKLQ
jgi:hypothetical protein